jgi:hypothetical protein
MKRRIPDEHLEAIFPRGKLERDPVHIVHEDGLCGVEWLYGPIAFATLAVGVIAWVAA